MCSVAIIGAGPAGLSAALYLTQQGAEVDVFDAAASVGGLAGSARLWGRTVDYGSHIVVPRHPFTKGVWEAFVGERGADVSVRRGLVVDGATFDYPLRVKPFLRSLGPVGVARAGLSLLWARLHPDGGVHSAADWVTQRYGAFLYRRIFQGYAEKYIGLPGREIDPVFARNLIGERPGGALRKRVQRVVQQGSTVTETNRQRRFSYPREGMSQVWEGMRHAIERAGGRVHLGTRVTGLAPCDDGRVEVRTLTGPPTRHDRVLSGMPLDALLRALPDVPLDVLAAAAALHYRATVLLFLHVVQPDPFPYNWIYLYDDRARAGRVTNFFPWIRATGQDTHTGILCLEYWCNRDEALFQMPTDGLAQQAVADLALAGIVVNVLDAHAVRLPVTHAVLDRAYADRLDRVNAYLGTVSWLRVLGRQGTFQHSSVTGAMLDGYRAAREYVATRQAAP